MGTKVALIGVGNLGLAIAQNLIDAGHHVTGYRRGAMDDLVAAGGSTATSPRDAVAGADLVITCLPDGSALAQAMSGEDGVCAGARPGLAVVETSTMKIGQKRHQSELLARTGAVMLDCPLSGTPPMMRARKAAMFASGDVDLCSRWRALLEDVAPNFHYVGPFGSGLIVKYIANMLVAVHNLAAAEAFSFAVHAGADASAVLSAISGSPASSQMFEMRGAMMAARDYSGGGGTLDQFDVNLAYIQGAAAETETHYSLIDTAARAYADARKAGLGDQELAAIFEHVLERTRNPKP